jgi:putative tryptophan/tyrosine transport system substrate-binding protein
LNAFMQQATQMRSIGTVGWIHCLLAALGAFAAPPLAQAQPAAKSVRIGALALGTPRASPAVDLFLRALREHGYVEGENLAFEYKTAEGKADRLPALAAELVQQQVDVIVTEGNAAALAAKSATQAIPIVMAISGDPVRGGIVASLARPGGNVTGTTLIHPELSAKRLQLLKEAAPGIRRVAVIWNPSSPASADTVRETELAARELGLQVQPFEARSPAQVDGALQAVAAARVDALLTVGDGMLWTQRARIVDFAIRQRLPAVFPDGEFAEAGGLMAYGPNAADSLRRAAVLVDKVLKGARPADLPIEQPTQMDLLLNLRTARVLGLAVPQALRVRADRLIDDQ